MNGLKGWIKQFPREEAEARVSTLENELAGLKQALALHDSLSGEGGNGSAPPSTGEIPTKPQGISMILSEAKGPMSPGEIMAEMVERGWLPGDPKYRKRFYATLSRMNSEDRVKRLPDRRYVLPSTGQEALRPPY